jgi:hypothetical protein
MLATFHARARLLSTRGAPYARQALVFPARPVERFYDVATDPMHDACYLHGFVVRDSALPGAIRTPPAKPRAAGSPTT